MAQEADWKFTEFIERYQEHLKTAKHALASRQWPIAETAFIWAEKANGAATEETKAGLALARRMRAGEKAAAEPVGETAGSDPMPVQPKTTPDVAAHSQVLENIELAAIGSVDNKAAATVDEILSCSQIKMKWDIWKKFVPGEMEIHLSGVHLWPWEESDWVADWNRKYRKPYAQVGALMLPYADIADIRLPRKSIISALFFAQSPLEIVARSGRKHGTLQFLFKCDRERHEVFDLLMQHRAYK